MAKPVDPWNLPLEARVGRHGLKEQTAWWFQPQLSTMIGGNSWPASYHIVGQSFHLSAFGFSWYWTTVRSAENGLDITMLSLDIIMISKEICGYCSHAVMILPQDDVSAMHKSLCGAARESNSLLMNQMAASGANNEVKRPSHGQKSSEPSESFGGDLGMLDPIWRTSDFSSSTAWVEPWKNMRKSTKNVNQTTYCSYYGWLSPIVKHRRSHGFLYKTTN